MEQENLTEQAQSEATHVEAADAQAAVSNSLSLAELNQTLGKSFPDKETALKSLRDTQSFVGKKVAAAEPAPDNGLKAQVESLTEQVFYANNPQFKGHESIIQAMGSNPSEVTNSEAFKSYYEKAKVADEVAASRSVVSSNSRLSQSNSVLENAVNTANARGTTQEDVALVLARGILGQG